MKPIHLLLGATLVAVPACKREDDGIKVYKVSKETGVPKAPGADPHAGMGAAMPGGTQPGGDAANPNAGMPGMGGASDPHAGLTPEQLAAAGGAGPPPQQASDSPPAHWKKLPPSAFLLAKYQATGDGAASTDISFSSLRTAPGSLLNNINRWRDQLGQPPIDEAAAKALTILKTSFGDGVLVDVEGMAAGADPDKDGRLIGIIAEEGSNAWYFKMRGNAALTAREKDNFIAWAQSVKVAPAAPAASPAKEVPAGNPVPPVPSAGPVSWKLPEGWIASPNPGSRHATINIPGPGETKAEIAITKFPGDVGGDLANVNRWRGQIELPPVAESELAPMVTKITAGPKTIQMIDCTGPKVRCAVGWVSHGGHTWFFKLTGPDALVGTEKAKFAAFLESVRFNQPER